MFFHTLVKWDGGMSLHLYHIFCFVLSLIAASQAALGVGSLSKVAVHNHIQKLGTEELSIKLVSILITFQVKYLL